MQLMVMLVTKMSQETLQLEQTKQIHCQFHEYKKKDALKGQQAVLIGISYDKFLIMDFSMSDRDEDFELILYWSIFFFLFYISIFIFYVFQNKGDQN